MKFSFIIFIILSYACSSNHLYKHNQITQADYIYVNNSKAQLTVSFFGDYKFLRPTRKGLNQYREFTKNYINPHILISKARIVYLNRTVISPFFYSASWILEENQVLTENVKEDFVYYGFDKYYEKIGSFEDSTKFWRIRIYPISNKYFVFAAFSGNLQSQNNLSKKEVLSELLKDEFDWIFKSIKVY